MGSTNFSSIFFALCFFLLYHGLLAQFIGQGTTPWRSFRHGSLRGCRFDRLQAFEPLQSVQSQAGRTEYYDVFNEQFQCTGVSIIRRIIEPRGLFLPHYSNTPTLVYIIEGRGIAGPTFPGCSETYQRQFQQFDQARASEGQSQGHKFRDEHQKILRFGQGDVIALPAGIAHWCYNDGDVPIVALYVSDTSSTSNQLDPRHREFLLAGNNRGDKGMYEQQAVEHCGENFFNGFDGEPLSEALGVSRDLTRQLQSQNDQRGEIIRVERGLTLLNPSTSMQEQEQEQYQTIQYQQGRYGSGSYNGLDETFCALRVTQNIDDPNRADIYNPRAGRIRHLNSQNFPILDAIQMSVVKANLYQNALVSPFWNINAHSVVYITQGRARVQVVSNRGKTVFNDELSRGQLLIIPQNYAVIKKARREGCAYIAFKTNPNSMVSHIAGKNSILRALPDDILANAYHVSRGEARRLKRNRGDEFSVFAPSFSYQSYQDFPSEVKYS